MLNNDVKYLDHIREDNRNVSHLVTSFSDGNNNNYNSLLLFPSGLSVSESQSVKRLKRPENGVNWLLYEKYISTPVKVFWAKLSPELFHFAVTGAEWHLEFIYRQYLYLTMYRVLTSVKLTLAHLAIGERCNRRML